MVLGAPPPVTTEGRWRQRGGTLVYGCQLFVFLGLE